MFPYMRCDLRVSFLNSTSSLKSLFPQKGLPRRLPFRVLRYITTEWRPEEQKRAISPDSSGLVMSKGVRVFLTVFQRGITTIDPRQARAVFYNDMPRAEADYWTSQLLPQSIGVFWSQTTYASWRYIPTTYVLCGQDQCVTLPYAEMMLQTASESRPNMIDTVERCEDGGHSIMLSRVEWTTNMLRRAAGEAA
jgi:hypothetical protein